MTASKLLACGGDTSGIITKGIGPSPTAKDITKRTMAKLAAIDSPLFRPYPTTTRDRRAPNADPNRSTFRPTFSMRIIGGKVMITLITVIPIEMYGPNSGSDLERISLL